MLIAIVSDQNSNLINPDYWKTLTGGLALILLGLGCSLYASDLDSPKKWIIGCSIVFFSVVLGVLVWAWWGLQKLLEASTHGP